MTARHVDLVSTTIADRARTVLDVSPVLAVEVDGIGAWDVAHHAAGPDGARLLLIADDSVLGPSVNRCATAPSCTVRAARLSPLPGPDRTLSSVTAQGRLTLLDAAECDSALTALSMARPELTATIVLLHDDLTLLRIAVESLTCDGTEVPMSAFRATQPDPLAPFSDYYVQHLLEAHVSEFVQLCRLLDPELAAGARTIAPVALDRHGLTVQVRTADATTLTRLDFPAAVHRTGDLPGAMAQLLRRAGETPACPFEIPG